MNLFSQRSAADPRRLFRRLRPRLLPLPKRRQSRRPALGRLQTGNRKHQTRPPACRHRQETLIRRLARSLISILRVHRSLLALTRPIKTHKHTQMLPQTNTYNCDLQPSQLSVEPTFPNYKCQIPMAPFHFQPQHSTACPTNKHHKLPPMNTSNAWPVRLPTSSARVHSKPQAWNTATSAVSRTTAKCACALTSPPKLR